MRCLFPLIAALWAGTAAAQPSEEDQFVWDSLTGTFYHELGHALVDQFTIPIYGQEEDAADVLAAYLIAKWHKPAEAERIARAVALTFYADFIDYEDNGRDVYWAGVHGPSLQRMFNHLCIFIGSDMDAFYDLGLAFGMDQDRLDYCDFEFDAADQSWGPIISRMGWSNAPGRISFEGFSAFDDTAVGQWAHRNGDRIINQTKLPRALPVRVEPCRQSNAFYDPSWGIIQMCIEQEDTHRDQFKAYGGAFVSQ